MSDFLFYFFRKVWFYESCVYICGRKGTKRGKMPTEKSPHYPIFDTRIKITGPAAEKLRKHLEAKKKTDRRKTITDTVGATLLEFFNINE